MGHGMTLRDLRTTVARPTQMRQFATVPLNREPLTQRFVGAARNRRVSVAAASVSGVSLGLHPRTDAWLLFDRDRDGRSPAPAGSG